MAEAAVGSMLVKLQQLALREARTLVAVDEDIRSLRDKLMWMQAFLRDVEPSRRVQPNELIKVWLQQTRDAVFDAEDAVDQYFIQIDLSRFPSCSRTIFSFCASFTTQVRVRHDLSRRIRLINARLEEIISNKDRYRLGESSTLGLTWRPSSSTTSLLEKMDDVVLPLVGRENCMRDLKSKLLKNNGHQYVISVFGESGVGKTKLVRDLSDKRQTLSHFDIIEWVSFGLNLSASDILRLIIRRITDEKACPKEKIMDILAEELKGKKYLLVIDAELSSSEWSRLFSMLPKDVNPGSRIVRISQSKPEKPPPPYEDAEIVVKRFVDKEVVLNLFRETFLMEKRTALPDEDIEKYKEKIFDNTKGLPLAVVLLSGLLRTKEYPQEWETVFEHLTKMQSKTIDKILSLCFDDLHYDLKSCFLYFAALPVNSLIRAQNMVCLWMAEGFLTPKAKTIEKVGEQYLKELIDRRLVNLAPIGYDVPGDERVTVQSKVHAFLRLEAQEESFTEIHSGDDTPALSTVRRLSLQNHTDKYAALVRPLPKLRAILSDFETEEEAAKISEAGGSDGHGNGDDAKLPRRGRGRARNKETKSCVQELMQNSRFLRVVHFDGLEIGKKLPSEVSRAANLHYLRVTSCSLEKIPPSIGSLCSLQTLDVRYTNVSSLPDAFWRIQTLRHVLGHRLVLPKRVGRLGKLQTLNSVKTSDNEAGCWDRNTFTSMTGLWSLHIRIQRRDTLGFLHNREALLTALTILKYLVVLTIKADTIPPELFTKSKLPRLKAMELEGKLNLDQRDISKMAIRTRLPNLRKLQLKGMVLSQEFIKQLGDLQFLSALTLRGASYTVSQLIFDHGFHSLTELMVSAENLDRIEIHELALPQLKDLDVVGHGNDFHVEIHGHLVRGIKGEDEKPFKILHVKQQVQVENKKTEDSMS